MINLDDKPIKKLTSPKEFKFNETVSKCKHEVQ